MLNWLKQKWNGISDDGNTRMPHERYPRVLNWRKGDTFQRQDRKYWPLFFAGRAQLIGLTPQGDVFLQDAERKWHLSIDDVCKNCWNSDAVDREISKRIKESKGYTNALAEFNRNVEQLQKRDEQNGVDLPDECYPQVPIDVYI